MLSAVTGGSQEQTAVQQKRKEAATLILRVYRKYVARVHLIDQGLFQKSCEWVSKVDFQSQRMQLLPRTILILKELPVVIYQCKTKADARRFVQMREARTLARQKKLSCVVFPKSSYYIDPKGNHFIFVEKLSDQNSHDIKRMVYYYENRADFGEIAEQVTTLFCYSYLPDIIGNHHSVLNHIVEDAEAVRSDNVFFINRKVAFLDIEGFRLESKQFPRSSTVRRALSLGVQMFPYNAERVMAVGQRFYQLREQTIAVLQKTSQASAMLHKIICEDTISFYERNGITFHKPDFIRVTPARLEELKQTMTQILIHLNDGENEILGPQAWMYEECLGKKAEETIALFQQRLLPIMIDAIERTIKEEYDSFLQLPVATSWSEFVKNRTMEDDVLGGIFYTFKTTPGNKALSKEVFSEAKFSPTYHLFEELLPLLIGKEIAFYKKTPNGKELLFF